MSFNCDVPSSASQRAKPPYFTAQENLLSRFTLNKPLLTTKIGSKLVKSNSVCSYRYRLRGEVTPVD